MKSSRVCRRGHAMKGANVRKQSNRETRVDGSTVIYKTRVCVACARYRAARKAKGLAVKDLRCGARR